MTAHPILTGFVALVVLWVAALAWLAYQWNRRSED